MTKIVIAMALSLSASAWATDYPVLDQYTAKAEVLLADTQGAKTTQDLEAIKVGARELVSLGVETMVLYAEKNPICQGQFDVMFSELDQMESMTLADAKARYHDGKGLPVAPKHCYLGRSQVIHPIMNILRLNGVWSEQIREKVAEEFDEVIEHVEKIRKNLDNPPN